MSRENKLKKLKRRRERGIPSKTGRHLIKVAAEPSAGNLIAFSYNITFEALIEPGDESRSLEKIDEAERERLHDLIHSDPPQAIEPLRQLLAAHPGNAVLTQWLASALAQTDQTEESDRLIEENYRDHPKYLFARIDFARLLMSRGETAAIDALFEHRFDLRGMYPDRDTFHVTEFAAFAAFMVDLWILRDKVDTAIIYANMLERVIPDHPFSIRAQTLIVAAKFRSVSQLLNSKMLNRGVVLR